MKKRTIFALVLLIAINLILGLLYHNALRDKEKVINELCGTITLSCIAASSRLDEAMESADRRLILMAGIEIEELSGLLGSSVSMELGVHNTYGQGSLSSLAELIIWGDSTCDIAPLGSPNNNTPLDSDEITIIKNISSALKEVALSFYDESVTENTYMNETRSHSNISAINYALLVLQTTTGSIFEKQ